MLDGAVFIYPTDTIYGIGCIATNAKSVQQIKRIKQRTSPFSIIVPGMAWIKEHCRIPTQAYPWLKRLPGPYTLILPLKIKKGFSRYVNNGRNTLGVRMPEHWILRTVQKLKVPIVTTSANVHAQHHMTSLDNLNPRIKKMVDFIVYEGPTEGKPSMIINLSHEKVKIIRK